MGELNRDILDKIEEEGKNDKNQESKSGKTKKSMGRQGR